MRNHLQSWLTIGYTTTWDDLEQAQMLNLAFGGPRVTHLETTQVRATRQRRPWRPQCFQSDALASDCTVLSYLTS